MLKAITLTNFKSFEAETIQLGRLTFLIGANASGKSNLLDAIRFLQGIGLNFPIMDILRGRTEGGREVWPGVRGGVSEVAMGASRAFSIKTDWSLDGQRLVHDLGCDVSGHPMLTRESLKGSDLGKYLFDTEALSLGEGGGRSLGGAMSVAMRGLGGGRNPRAEYPAIRSLLGQVEPGDRVDSKVTEWSRRLLSAMRSAYFIDITPARMRDYVPRESLELGSEGQNISAVMRRLCGDGDQKSDVVDWLTELCAPELADLGFEETGLGDVMLALIEKDGTRVSARSMSDGTLRFLGELIALKTAPEGSLLLIEEIENGLHPSRIHLLVEAMEALVRERDLQVIATTHSPLVLQALSEPTLRDTVVFARNQDATGTVMSRLGDFPDFDAVCKRRGIDHLFVTGWLERAL